MTKNIIIFSLLICITACIDPSLANDSLVIAGAPPLAIRSGSDNGINLTSSASQPTPSAADPGQTNSQTTGKSSHATKSSLPKKAFSVATAFFIGTPVCVVRRSKYEEWYGVHGMVGDSESKCKKVLAGAFMASVCFDNRNA